MIHTLIKMIQIMLKCMTQSIHYIISSPYDTFFGQYIYKIGSKLYRQIVRFPMGTCCAPLVADLFLCCYERNLMLSLSDNNQTDIIEDFNSTSRYLDDLLYIDNAYFNKWLVRYILLNLIVGHPEPEKKFCWHFEYILASMLKVYLGVFEEG